MLFNSYEFLLVFLPTAILAYGIADRYAAARMPALILLSLIFYGYWDVKFVPVMVGSILVNWLAAKLYAATKNRMIVTAAIVANLGVLGIFKYTNFLTDNLSYLSGLPIAHLQPALPLGISFFTFHHIMYLVDLRRGRAPIYPLDRYALYICLIRPTSLRSRMGAQMRAGRDIHRHRLAAERRHCRSAEQRPRSHLRASTDRTGSGRPSLDGAGIRIPDFLRLCRLLGYRDRPCVDLRGAVAAQFRRAISVDQHS